MILSFVLLVGLVAGQLPSGMVNMGAGGGDEVETHNAEELTDETFDDRRMENELVRTCRNALLHAHVGKFCGARARVFARPLPPP